MLESDRLDPRQFAERPSSGRLRETPGGTMKLLTCLTALMLLAGCSDGPEEITAYPAVCLNSSARILPFAHYAVGLDFDAAWSLKRKSETDCHISALGPTTYRLNRERAEVVYMSGLSPSKLVNCTFFDQENWLCAHPDYATGVYKNSKRSGKTGFQNGLPVHFTKESKDKSPLGVWLSVFYLRAWQHWAVVLINMTGYRAQSKWLIPEQEAAS